MSSVYVTSATPKSEPTLSAEDFILRHRMEGEQTLYSYHAGHLGTISILERRTGYSGGWWDTETGFMDDYASNRRAYKHFWLASGHIDIREWLENRGPMTWSECVAYVKINANTCVGVEV